MLIRFDLIMIQRKRWKLFKKTIVLLHYVNQEKKSVHYGDDKFLKILLSVLSHLVGKAERNFKEANDLRNNDISYRIEIAQPVFNKDHQAIPITSSTFQIVNYLSWIIQLPRLRVLFHLLSINGAAISVTLTSVLVVLITLWVSAILISNGTLEDICVGHSYKMCQENIHISVFQKLWMTW